MRERQTLGTEWARTLTTDHVTPQRKGSEMRKQRDRNTGVRQESGPIATKGAGRITGKVVVLGGLIQA